MRREEKRDEKKRRLNSQRMVSSRQNPVEHTSQREDINRTRQPLRRRLLRSRPSTTPSGPTLSDDLPPKIVRITRGLALAPSTHEDLGSSPSRRSGRHHRCRRGSGDGGSVAALVDGNAFGESEIRDEHLETIRVGLGDEDVSVRRRVKTRKSELQRRTQIRGRKLELTQA